MTFGTILNNPVGAGLPAILKLADKLNKPARPHEISPIYKFVQDVNYQLIIRGIIPDKTSNIKPECFAMCPDIK